MYKNINRSLGMADMAMKLREMLNSQDILRVGGAFDPLSAKLVEFYNFDAIWASSFTISAINLLPDAGLMTMTEFLAAAKSMKDCCNIPVIADCDTGFGGPTNVSHMVKKYESAGIAAVSIEDKVFPKQNSLLEGGTHKIVPEKEFVAKILAAKNSKQSENFMVIARIEALIAGLGIKEAISRADAYENAGADAILIHSKNKTPDEIFEFCDKWDGSIPLVVVPTSYPSVSLEELIDHKIKMTIYANQTLRASYASMSKILKKLSETKKLTDIENDLASMEDIFKIQQTSKIKEQEKEIENDLREMGYIN